MVSYAEQSIDAKIEQTKRNETPPPTTTRQKTKNNKTTKQTNICQHLKLHEIVEVIYWKSQAGFLFCCQKYIFGKPKSKLISLYLASILTCRATVVINVVFFL